MMIEKSVFGAKPGMEELPVSFKDVRTAKPILALFCIFPLVVCSAVSAHVNDGEWPLVSMRHMSSTTFDVLTMRALIACDMRHPGCWDEYWLAEGEIPSADRMIVRAKTLAAYGELLKKAGILPGFQQGVTLGHDFSRKSGNDLYPLPDDAFQVDIDGRRTGYHCPRSPAVLEMEERYAETYVGQGGVVSFWLDDDLRLGFYKDKAYACFCDRCMADFNRRASTSFNRTALVARLSSKERDDPLRETWAEFKAESLAGFAAAARHGALRANPNVRLGYQAISSATIGSGVDYHAILWALSDNGRRPVGIRPGHGYYHEGEVPRDALPMKLLDVAREAERCRAYRDLSVNIVYEQENYPHYVMFKSPEACLKEAALGLAVGCDAVSLYWYSSDVPEPLEHYEDYSRLAVAWRPYLERLAKLSKGTHLGGVAIRADPGLMRSVANTIPACCEQLHRRSLPATILARLGVPVTVEESGTKSFVRSDRIVATLRSDERRKLLDELDAAADGPLPVRIDKMHQLLVYPRVTAEGRLVSVTMFNLSIGQTQGLVLRARRAVSRQPLCLRPTQMDVALLAETGEGDELRIHLPDLHAFSMMTVSFSNAK